ncbi:histidine kinase dimerization/phospho-acceptor domain-containing protein, partial [Sinomonas sp. G460-2]|uniref:histidine kinase dimerization/phospho-acceptor domain-containing protein n=1 Tax=Sinomonas sp. G460-2 TaxID=3393464 RepID=UPI0039EE8105
MSTSEQALLRWARRNFQHLGLRARAALCQLPLVASVLAAPLAMPAEWGRASERPLFVAGLLLLVAATGACFAIPWDRLSPGALLAVPIQDFVAIGLLNQGSADGLRGLGTLSIVPVIWIAATTPTTWAALALCLAGPGFIALPALVQAFAGLGSVGLGDALLLPPLLLTVAVAVRAARAGLTIQERQLRAQQSRLQKLLVESQSTERLLATLLDAVNVGIVAVGPDAVPVRSNRRFRELVAESGWVLPGTTWDDSVGQRLFARDRRTPLPPEQRPLRRAAAGERIDEEIVWLGRGRGARAMSVVARPVDGPEGGGVISFGDVTALAGAVEDKAELVRTVAHEFRSPLTAVLGNLDLVLESASLAPEDRWRLDVAQRSAERLIDLAADLAVSS